MVVVVKNLPANAEDVKDPWVGKIPLEKEIAVHSNILAWRIPCLEKPEDIWSMGSQRVMIDWSDLAHMHDLLTLSGIQQ